jgi:signal transduction histidine kinase
MGRVNAVADALWREPFSRRARREALWSVVGFGTGAAAFALVAASLYPGTAASAGRGALVLGLAVVILVTTGAATAISDAHRRLAARLLDVQVEAPTPAGAGRGPLGRAAARLRDRGTWRAMAYLLVKMPVAALHEYALLWWLGLVNLTYPLWWGLFRNHDPGVELDPVLALTPFGFLRIATLPGALAVSVAGGAMVLAAPWVTRAVTAVDRWLLVTLLGPGALARRVRHLEASRAEIAEDAVSTLRRIERDLHDGAQTQLATLAMKLGQAREKLDHDSAVTFDPAGALALVDAAHRHAKEALVELRDIARGVRPPVLDVGLDAALATLAARSPVPTDLRVATAERPSGAIETIAYFSVAELLANVARHGRARHARVEVTGRDGRLRLAVSDDGVGGARVGAGSGLTGLADRIRAVDGRLDVSSPRGGPTTVVVDLPLST